MMSDVWAATRTAAEIECPYLTGRGKEHFAAVRRLSVAKTQHNQFKVTAPTGLAQWPGRQPVD